jgi:hypothetical protein
MPPIFLVLCTQPASVTSLPASVSRSSPQVFVLYIIIYCFSFDLQRYELLMKKQKDLREKDGSIDGNGAFVLKLIKIALVLI